MKRALTLIIGIILIYVIFAYGFEVTDVNLAELGSQTRQESLTRILRALARPDFFTYDQEEFVVEVAIFIPCPPGGAPASNVDTSGPYMVVTPACAEPGSEVNIEGFNFQPNTTGPLNFIPPSGVSLQLGRIEPDSGGHFVATVELRRDRVSDDAQSIRAVTRRNIGAPYLSKNGVDTIDKIIETVFMALLATVIGTALAVPISFFAARNLMKPVTSPLTSVALTLIFLPFGIAIGAIVANWLGSVGQMLAESVAMNLGGLVAGPVIALAATRWALPPAETTTPGAVLRVARMMALLVAVLVAVLVVYLLSHIAELAGDAITPALGSLGFLGLFISKLGQILRIVILPICALIGGGLAVSIAGRIGQALVERLAPALNKTINLVLSALAGAVVAALIGGALNWLYQIDNVTSTLLIPAAIGGVIGFVVAPRATPNASLNIGLTVYTIARTLLNALRSVEALIMAIVFAVWVGIGPFAGMLALALHTVVSLGKLYSEQVESISAGPLEAVTATGANRLQMIIYSVVPQIIPPYISFTMYRWDINVRMSTIIGFVGGGGIGFLLQQNINLLNYRAASAQIVAIAIVVSLMDYVSSKLRERTI
jgi:phosphonate ABC transporter permease subunit PhnE